MTTKNRAYFKTIDDFGRQWERHGLLRRSYWTSNEMFEDHFGIHFDPSEIQGKIVLEIGSGSGRILNMLSTYAPLKLIGVEPSSSSTILSENFKHLQNIEILNAEGENFETYKCDYIFIIGVLHHINRPEQVLENAYKHLKSGGKLIIWVYGYENNYLYVLLQKFLRFFTRNLNDSFLDFFSYISSYVLDFYSLMSRFLFFSKLPLSSYLKNVYGRCERLEKKYIIFDQLNPTYSKYYSRDDLQNLLSNFSFSNLIFYHRHGYSWTVISTKP